MPYSAPHPESPTFITSSELREMLGGVAHGTLTKNVEAGILPCPIRLGRKLLWYEKEVHEALAARRIEKKLPHTPS